MDTHNINIEEKSTTVFVRGTRLCVWMSAIVCACILILLFFYSFIYPPSTFPSDSIITISPGENLSGVIKDFESKRVIRSATVFQSLVILFGGEKRVIAGDYLLENPQNAVTLAERVVRGSFGMTEVKVTVPEGFSVVDIGNVLEKKLVTFDKETFVRMAKHQEGYLFPDTYFFPPTATSTQIMAQMKNNFDVRIKEFEPAIATSGHSEYDILKMASILEGEATGTKDRQIVAGILWNRLKNGMPLQTDSTLRYVTGKTSAQLTMNDLKMSSPYNTYVYTGLPPTPINNPGADAISAALHPTPTAYVYFLTGTDGLMHYAKTFAEHVANERKYLK